MLRGKPAGPDAKTGPSLSARAPFRGRAGRACRSAGYASGGSSASFAQASSHASGSAAVSVGSNPCSVLQVRKTRCYVAPCGAGSIRLQDVTRVFGPAAGRPELRGCLRAPVGSVRPCTPPPAAAPSSPPCSRERTAPRHSADRFKHTAPHSVPTPLAHRMQPYYNLTSLLAALVTLSLPTPARRKSL